MRSLAIIGGLAALAWILIPIIEWSNRRPPKPSDTEG